MFNKSSHSLMSYQGLIAVTCLLVLGTSANSQCPETPAAAPVTVGDEVPSIPNSRQFVNGSGTTIDTATAGQIKVNGSLPNSGVSAGSYTNTDITVNAQGVITSAANGSGSGGSSTRPLTAGNVPASVPNVIVPANGLIQPLPFSQTLTVSASGTEYTVPTGSSDALGVCAGPDRNVWFTENNQNKIASISPTGTFTEYNIPTSSSAPWGICAGPDGSLWFTENSGNKIGKVTTSGVFVEYSISTSNSQPTGICAGPDGNVWFTENNGNKIGKISTAGAITEYTVPTGSSAPRSICAGPDGNLWFVEAAANKIAKITTSGTITEYTVPTGSSSPYSICAGADGNLWFTESATNKVGKVTVAGSFTEYTVPTSSSTPDGICAGPDGRLWLCEYATGKIASVSTSGTITEYSLPTGGAGATYICVGPDGNLWLSEQSASKIATWAFAVAGTIPVLNSFVAGDNTVFSRTSTGITITTGSGGVVPAVVPIKRFFHDYPAGLSINNRVDFGTQINDGISGSINGGVAVDGVLTNNISTAATSGQYSYEQTGDPVTRYDLKPKMAATLVPQSTTNVRYWACALNPHSASVIKASDTPTFTGGGCGFRYSTSAGDTTWKFGTTSGGGVWQFTDTGVSLAAGTKITFAVDASDPTQIKGYINGALVATNISDLPSSTQSEFMTVFCITALTNSAVNFDYGSYDGESY
jgi:virginiamycin B lyase